MSHGHRRSMTSSCVSSILRKFLLQGGRRRNTKAGNPSVSLEPTFLLMMFQKTSNTGSARELKTSRAESFTFFIYFKYNYRMIRISKGCMYVLNEVFVISRTIKVEVKVIRPKPKADIPNRDPDYSRYHKTESS